METRMTDTDTQTLVERLQGPVQWGYMCLADGGFIADDTPLEAANFIEARLSDADARVSEAVERCAAICEEQTRLNVQARVDRADDELAFQFQGLGNVISTAIRDEGAGG